MSSMYILFPSDYLHKKQVDCDFVKEAEGAEQAGWNILLFDQEVWDKERKFCLVSKKPEQDSTVVYRGWMMKPDEYSEFFKKSSLEGLNLITSPASYSLLHDFQNGYRFVKEDAPQTVFFNFAEDAVSSLDMLNDTFNRFMVKDFVKSAKNADFPKFFKHPSQEYFSEQMEKFLEYRGELYTGGIQIKEYLEPMLYQGQSNEVRVFYANGEPISVAKNSDQPGDAKNVPVELIRKYKDLPSPFYTVDFMECADGDFNVIETGDGGVSGLTASQDPFSFYQALTYINYDKENDYEDDREEL